MTKSILSIGSLRLRERTDEQQESRTVEGCAIVFNTPTTLFEDATERLREQIAPEALSAAFLREQDIKLNLLHDRSLSLARFNRGEGTLQLDLRSDGLYFTCELPKCDLADRALALIANGTYTGCSFEFYMGDYDTVNSVLDAQTGKTDTLLTIRSFEAITALTIAMDPAYDETSIDIRELLHRENEVANPGGSSAADDTIQREARAYHAFRARQRERQLAL